MINWFKKKYENELIWLCDLDWIDGDFKERRAAGDGDCDVEQRQQQQQQHIGGEGGLGHQRQLPLGQLHERYRRQTLRRPGDLPANGTVIVTISVAIIVTSLLGSLLL